MMPCSEISPTRRVILIRHGAIGHQYDGLCYGQSDVELSEVGRAQSRRLAEEATQWPVSHLYHSGLKRTEFLAQLIFHNTGIEAEVSVRLRERDFGDWELRPWADIYAETGPSMNGFIEEPETFAPPGGETTFQVRDRVMAWYEALPGAGTILAVAHGGPIMALLGTLRGLPPDEWLHLAPSYCDYAEIVGATGAEETVSP
jgi:broad specificity phosphatase PhoE